MKTDDNLKMHKGTPIASVSLPLPPSLLAAPLSTPSITARGTASHYTDIGRPSQFIHEKKKSVVSDTIGFVVPELDNTFHALLLAAVENEASAAGRNVTLFVTHHRKGREDHCLNLLINNQIDGLIFSTTHPDLSGDLSRLINNSGRVVIVNEDMPGVAMPTIYCNNFQGGYLAGCELARNGHKHVLFISGPPEMQSSMQRRGGLSKALYEHFGDEAYLSVFPGDYSIEHGRKSAERFLDTADASTAIFASNEVITLGLMEVLLSRGVSIPNDVSVISFDDVGPMHLFNPPLTAIRQPVEEIGRRAVRKLIETNWQERAVSREIKLLDTKLIKRASIGPPRTLY